jgi:predicted Zn-dependent peptidase
MSYADTYIAHVNAVTLADVQRVADAYLHPDRFIQVVVTDAKAHAAVADTPAAPSTPGAP